MQTIATITVSRDPTLIDQSIANTIHCESSETQIDINMNELIRLQREDEAYRDIIEYIEQDVLPCDESRARTVMMESPMFTICDNALYRTYMREGKGIKTQRKILQIAIPQCLKHIILANAHDSPVSGGHFGISRTIDNIREIYNFPKMSAEIAKYVKSCTACNQHKQPAKPSNATIHPMPVPDTPWIRISTDILGKLPKCRNTGNQYVIVFIDYFTKYVELIATQDIKAETVALALIERVILLHGSP